MLNPFIVEKDTLTKVAAIKELCLNLRKYLSQEFLQEDSYLSSDFKKQLKGYAVEKKSQFDRFECKICGKCFDEGRKLGGHVSRAHKGQMHTVIKEEASPLYFLSEKASSEEAPRVTRQRRPCFEAFYEESE